MTRLNIRGLLALVLTVLTLGLGQVPASAQVIGRVPYLTSNPCKGVTLSLAFAKSTGSNCLGGNKYASPTAIPGWTYTGGTPAGTGSYAARQDGSLQFFPSYTNLVPQSQTPDNAGWVKTDTTITANVVAAPDGTTTADLVTEGSAGTALLFSPSATISPSVQNVESYYLKRGNTDWIRLRFFSNDGTIGVNQWFNLATGAVGSTTYTGTPTNVVGAASDVGGGWYRVSISATLSTSTTANLSVASAIANGATGRVSGATYYAWGAQLELGSTASTYIPTTTAAVTVGTPRITDAGYWPEEARTNLLPQSQTFGTTWTATNSVLTENQTTAPDGTTTAYKLNDTLDGVSAEHFVAQSVTLTTGTVYTYSVYGKAGSGGRSLALRGSPSAWATPQVAFFDLSAGTVLGVSGGGSAAIQSISGGWYRCIFTTIATTSSASNSFRAQLANGTTLDYQGAGTSFNYIWQADLQAGSFATSPIPTTSVAVTRAADIAAITGLSINSSPLTILANVKIAPVTNTDTRFVTLSDGSNNNRVVVAKNAAGAIGNFVVSGGSTQPSADVSGISNPSANSAFNDAVSIYGTSGWNAAANGVVGGSSGAITPPVGPLNTLSVGSGYTGSAYNNGPIRRIVIYPRAFGNAEWEAATIGPVSFANDNAPEDMTAALWGWVA